jgi:uncharacterized protein (TIGR02996 family)
MPAPAVGAERQGGDLPARAGIAPAAAVCALSPLAGGPGARYYTTLPSTPTPAPSQETVDMEEVLLQALHASPADDRARLALAGWPDEKGDPRGLLRLPARWRPPPGRAEDRRGDARPAAEVDPDL